VSLGDDRRRVRAASENLAVLRNSLHQRTTLVRDWFEDHRAIILVSGGFVAGLLAGRRSFASVASSILSTASLGMSLMRSPLASLLMAKSLDQHARTEVIKDPLVPPQG
jgi:hypothetical protein